MTRRATRKPSTRASVWDSSEQRWREACRASRERPGDFVHLATDPAVWRRASESGEFVTGLCGYVGARRDPLPDLPVCVICSERFKAAS